MADGFRWQEASCAERGSTGRSGHPRAYPSTHRPATAHLWRWAWAGPELPGIHDDRHPRGCGRRSIARPAPRRRDHHWCCCTHIDLHHRVGVRSARMDSSVYAHRPRCSIDRTRRSKESRSRRTALGDRVDRRWRSDRLVRGVAPVARRVHRHAPRIRRRRSELDRLMAMGGRGRTDGGNDHCRRARSRNTPTELLE